MKEIAKSPPANFSQDKTFFFARKGEKNNMLSKEVPFFQNHGIQPKLEISQPGDKYEQEADEVAERVMTMPDPTVQMKERREEDEPIQMNQISRKEDDQDEPIQMKRIMRKEDDSVSTEIPHLETRLQETKSSGSPLPSEIVKPMEQNFGSDFSQVRIHTYPDAVQMNRDVNAQAFTHGANIYFNNGKYNPGSSAGKQLLAHELTHVVQQDSTNKIKRNAELDPNGQYKGNYIFNPGHDGLNSSFFNRVKKCVSHGTLSDAKISSLRADAIARNGTIMHAELLLMAAMRNPVNVLLMQAHTTGSLIIPMNQINQSDRDYLTNFGRTTIPNDIVFLYLRKLMAYIGLSTETFENADYELATASYDQIIQNAGAQFFRKAEELVGYALGYDPNVQLPKILMAMLNGASDSTSGDKVMAGAVYVVAKKANHPMASKILSGSLKVDALIPSAYQKIAGLGNAAYAFSTDSNVIKSDTLYVPTSIDIFNLRDRALIIHELTHAADDFAAVGKQQVDSLTLETHAYKEQGKYIMDQVLADPGVADNVNSASSYTKASPLFYWSMVAAAKDNSALYENTLIVINSAAPMSKPEKDIKTDLGATIAVINARIRTELLAYKNAKGQLLYSAAKMNVDGPAGQYFHP